MLVSPGANDRTAIVAGGETILWTRSQTLVPGRFVGRSTAPDALMALASNIALPQARSDVTASDSGLLAFRVDPARRNVVAWFSRDGRRLEEVDLETNSTFRVSPDGRFVAVTPGSDVWLFDIARRTRQRLSSTVESGGSPAWAGDSMRLFWRQLGSPLVFAHDLGSASTTTIDGVQTRSSIANSFDVTTNGRAVLSVPADRPDLMLTDIATGLETWLTESATVEINARLSPDTRFVAYTSHESGQREVHVRAVAGGTARQISIGGGDAPMWRNDTREVVYLRPDGTFMAVAVPSVAGGECGGPEALFQVQPSRTVAEGPRFDMTPDGQRFLIELQEGRVQPLVLVQNWTSLLAPD